MLSKSLEKYINSLRHKKYREERNRFVAEGEKVVAEFLREGCMTEKILATDEWLKANRPLSASQEQCLQEVTAWEMKKISALVAPSSVLLIGNIPGYEMPTALPKGYHLVLSTIQDPGNLGTIIRIADWFGMPYLFCSEDCADAWQPKVVQATMGSLARVQVIRTPVAQLFSRHPSFPVIGTFPDGENLFEANLPGSAFILIGNEAQGIDASLEPLLSLKLAIPRIGKAESLNAAVATGIICARLSSSR